MKLSQQTDSWCHFLVKKNITSWFNFATFSSLNQLTFLLSGLSLTNQKKKVKIRCKQRITDLLKLTGEVMFTSPATSILLPPLIGNVYHIRKGQGGGQVRLRGLAGLPPWSLVNDTVQSPIADLGTCWAWFSRFHGYEEGHLFVIVEAE